MNRTWSLALVLALALGLAVWIVRETRLAARHSVAPDAHAAVAGASAEPSAELAGEGRASGPARASVEAPLLGAEDPDPDADPTEAQLDELRATVAPGSIEGVVMRGSTPVDDGWVLLRGIADGGLPRAEWSDWGELSNTLLAPVRDGGIFRFDGLVADRYDLVVKTPVGGRRVSIELKEDVGTRRLLIVLGYASVFGVVFNEDGLPVSNEEVEISPAGRRIGETFAQRVRSGPDGSYRFDGLCAGRYWIVAKPLLYPSDEPLASVQVELHAGKALKADLGTPRAAGLWSGHVLTPSGRLHEEAWSFELLDRETGTTRRVRTTKNGTFEVRLPSGRYGIRTRLFQAHEVISELEMPNGDVVRNVLLPPARVYGTLARSDGRQLPSNLQVWLEGHTDKGLSIPATTRVEGMYAFNGVPPGVYTITTWPLRIDGAGDEGLKVELAEDALEWRLDLTLE